MPGDILKKRKIAVLGSRSVGEHCKIIIYDLVLIPLSRKVVPRDSVHRESVHRVLLPYY